MGDSKTSIIDRSWLFESKRDFSARWKIPMADDLFFERCINLLHRIIEKGNDFDQLADEVFLLAGEINPRTYISLNVFKDIARMFPQEKEFNFSDSEVCELLKRKKGNMVAFLEISEHIINFYLETKDDSLIAEFNDIARLSNKPVRLHYDEKYKFFPSGVEIFDVKLVDDVLEFLQKYPKAHQELSQALEHFLKKSYRDSVDKIRLSLELFLKELLGSDKSLENQEKEICQHFGNNLDQHIKSMFIKLMDCYEGLNNNKAKHDNKYDQLDHKLYDCEVEFLFYLTGVFIRLFMQIQDANHKR